MDNSAPVRWVMILQILLQTRSYSLRQDRHSSCRLGCGRAQRAGVVGATSSSCEGRDSSIGPGDPVSSEDGRAVGSTVIRSKAQATNAIPHEIHPGARDPTINCRGPIVEKSSATVPMSHWNKLRRQEGVRVDTFGNDRQNPGGCTAI